MPLESRRGVTDGHSRNIAIQKKTVTLVLVAALAVGGIVSFLGPRAARRSRIHDLHRHRQTPYPGASPEEVELEVTDRLETAIQTMGQVENVTSISRAGLSLVIVDLLSPHRSGQDPPGMGRAAPQGRRYPEPRCRRERVRPTSTTTGATSMASTSPSPATVTRLAEIEEYAKTLRRELLLVDGVGFGRAVGKTQPDAVYVEIPRAKMAGSA